MMSVNKPVNALDFQSIIMKLQHFWADQGCLIWQPYYSQVGAGTMNPGTFLRVLGPEPWKVAYVEPSIRPDDGRYGENPNRMQQHYQFQVILKPDPGNPQDIYLESLRAIGIDPEQHDIRFVEDNWEQPALGAWGLGWEVWLDGQEITQFTYFQQAGGITLNPVSVEITYGLERIAIALQNVRSFRDIRWNPERTYGDVNLLGEQEHSKYYFEVADVERMRELLALYEAETENALANNLILPAHDYILRSSQAFNVLDARGAIGVTERQAVFSRMREMAHRVSEMYMEHRQRLEYPWLAEESVNQSGGPAARREAPTLAAGAGTANADLLIEIGTEELPVAELTNALEQLRSRAPELLAELRLEHGEINVYGTPRRLVIFAENVAGRQPDQEVVHKGPPASRAYDAMGAPTKAAEGFARGKGVAVEALEVREVDGGQYVVACVHEEGRPAVQVLSEALPALVAGIRFDKSMRWNASNVAFSRPIRWLLALFGEQVIPFEYAGLSSANSTRGLRFHAPEEIAVAAPPDYFKALQAQGILLDPQARRAAVAEQVKAIIQAAGGDPAIDEGLLDEVTALVEAPTAFRGEFETEYLQLPPEVLVSVMKKHQRYFPIFGKDGKLLPHFVGVRNGDEQHINIVADGNAQVIRARFADATFFIREDLKKKLEDFFPRLGTLVFQFKLGSMLDKTHRIERLVDSLIPIVALDPAEAATARRAAQLCKADLATNMVIEMTSLQGVMGRYYARYSGETQAVADAIYEHYLPRFAGDSVPSRKAGLVVGLADRLDTLAGLFAAGLAPSGTRDPFAQRRAAIGLVQSLMAWKLHFDLRHGLEQAAANLPIPAAPEKLAECMDFIAGRLRSTLIEQGYRYDVVDSILAAQSFDPAGAFQAVKELSEWTARPDWNAILPAYARCVRITRDQKERFEVKPAALNEAEEHELFDAVRQAETADRRPGSVADFLAVFIPMIPTINKFFDKVLVMAEDPQVRANRLGILQRIAALTTGVGDFSKLEGF